MSRRTMLTAFLSLLTLLVAGWGDGRLSRATEPAHVHAEPPVAAQHGLSDRFGTLPSTPDPSGAAAHGTMLHPSAGMSDGFGAIPASMLNPLPTPGPTPAPKAVVLPAVPGDRALVLSGGPDTRPRVALTFDAGADVGYAARILDTLAAYGVKASFGMTGRWAERNPDLLRRMASEGHHFINHTYDHDSFTGNSTGLRPQTRPERWQQLDRTEAIVHELTGATTRPFFRPPYGDSDASVNADVFARGYEYNVMWTVDSGGWNGLTAAQIVRRCLSRAEPGAIYIFHVGAASEDAVALPAIIEGLRAAGYSMGTLLHLYEAD